jgi:glutaredoxin
LLKIIGTKNCSRCVTVKNILTTKGIEFEYFLLDELESTDKEKYTKLAEENNQLQFPFIVKDEKLIDIKEVL